MQKRRAFTLIELLVSIAILAVLSSLLFPVFSSAKEAARATVCLSQFKQVATSTLIYQSDYDDRYALARYRTRIGASSANDKTWVQLVLPYTTNFKVFKCPSDMTHQPESNAIFDVDLIPGDTYTKYYSASKRTNIGYNYLYLSPLLKNDVIIYPVSRSQTEIDDISNMILFGDSVNEVLPDGRPSGGGNYLIVPPCRYSIRGISRYDTFNLDDAPMSAIFIDGQGWTGGGTEQIFDPFLTVGGLWPRHNGHLTTIMTDGHIRSLTLVQATQGCDAQPNWNGLITDRSGYLWDMQ